MTTISQKKTQPHKTTLSGCLDRVILSSLYSVWVVIKTQIQQIILSKSGTVSLDQNELPSNK